ncbi:vitamin K epoxide reductase family protein [Chitinophaga varians]|uniref:vitamin K epoxide reductase family protein n=1 Tax=Chitinophaga varians TaxID=2202339 RepID=UPI00165F2860|nr:vitamin K epoxide reductase family protein [Chitinophaga varians]MBC9909093.1 thioredoxin domain-containing protein [Chitinophaga varians]
MRFLTFSLERKDDLFTIISELFKILNVRHSSMGLHKCISGHYEYPSLQTISDVINSYGLKTIAIKGIIQNLTSYETPFITQVVDSTTNKIEFTIVRGIESGVVTIFENKSEKWTDYSVLDFISIWIPVVLKISFHPGVSYQESNYNLNTKIERSLTKKKLLLLTFITFYPILLEYLNPHHFQISIALSIINSYVMLLATGATILLMQDEKSSLSSAKYCYLSSKFNCQKVLSSRYSKLGGVSISTIGFSYFFSILAIRFIAGVLRMSPDSLLATCAILPVPLVLFLVFIQWKIIKSWCSMCLFIHSMLAINVTTMLVVWDYSFKTPPDLIYIFLSLLVISFILAQIYSFALNLKMENKSIRKELLSLKYNTDLFNTILKQQRKISHPPNSVGMQAGSDHAKNTLVVVISPSCDHCKMSAPNVISILRNKEIRIHFILLPGKHYEESDTRIINQLLLEGIEGLSTIFQIHSPPDNINLKSNSNNGMEQRKRPNGNNLIAIEKMKNWAFEVGIKKVPTYIFNGHQLPEQYTISDLHYIID